MRSPGVPRLLRHSDDRAIAALALPALGALAADPLYSLADTAMVGHLGRDPLGAVAIGTAAFTASFWLFAFLAYGVTPQVARALGAGDARGAAEVGIQALLVAVAAGAIVVVVGVAFAPQIVRAFGGSGAVEELAIPYLRIRALSGAFVLVGQVGHGWLRGAHDTRTPMFVAIAGAGLNIVLDYLLIYPLGLGVAGAAWATVIAQGLTAGAFLFVLRPRLGSARRALEAKVMRSLLSVGGDLVVRTGALLAAMTFATALAARMGTVELGAWQIAMQVFLFLALTLDSVAIAAQPLMAGRLGAGNPDAAWDVSRRLMLLGFGLGCVLAVPVALLRVPLADVFTSDAAVIAAAAGVLGWVGLVQPLAAVAFTLDGILIGALQTRRLAAAMVASSALYALSTYIAFERGWGLAGLVGAATLWLLARVVTTGYIYLRRDWLVPPTAR